jgi:hypothetical protein
VGECSINEASLIERKTAKTIKEVQKEFSLIDYNNIHKAVL